MNAAGGFLLVIVCLGCSVLNAAETTTQPLSLAPIKAGADAMFEVKLKGGAEGVNTVLLLSAEQGRWQRVWGYHYQLGNGLCHGYITAAEVTPLRAKWDIVLHMPGDGMNKVSFLGRFVIAAERKSPEDPWTATYEGRIGPRPSFKNEAVVTSLPLPPRRAGATPLAVDEHPRLLFRKSDLPALKKRLATPFGQAAQAALAAGKDAASMGVLYQLTGDKRYAEEAKAPFEKELADQDYGMNGIGQVWAGRMFNLTIAWDCLREAWDADYNKKVDETFRARCEMLFFNSGGNMAATSNWAGPRNCAAGMASLTMAGDLGEPPPALGTVEGPVTRQGMPFHPLRLGIYRSDQPLVTELEALEGKDGPEWSVGKPFSQWIWSGILNVEFRGTQDLLSGLGGSAKAIPEEGTICKTTIHTADGANDIVIRFSKLPAELAGKDALDANTVLAGIAAGKTVLSSMFRVAADTPIRCALPPTGVKVWIDQTLLSSTQVYLLKPGAHRVLVSVTVAPNAVPKGRLDPEVTDVGSVLPAVRESIRLFGAHERGDWEARGRLDFDKDYLVGAGRMFHYQYCWLGMGDGGFFAESGHYSHDGGYGIYAYALMHWNVFGRLVDGRGDIARYVPRHVFSNPVGEPVLEGGRRTSRLRGLEIHGTNTPVAVAYPRSFPFLDPALQPASLWLWQQNLGIDPAKPETALRNDPIITFLNYPLEIKAQPPATPTWPLTWASRYRGWYGFRNGFKGAEQDALVQVYAKSSSEMGWNQAVAGTMAVQALGQAWATCQGGREGTRHNETLVHFPTVFGFGGGYGLVRDYRTEPDGSGSLSIDLRQVYAEPLTGRRPPLLDKNGMFERGVSEPLGPITQGRFLAVDYSGKSGCPVVLVIVDRIDGSKGLQRYWQWRPPLDLAESAKFEERSFTLSSPRGTLRANFVHPPKPEWKRSGEVKLLGNPPRGKSTVLKTTKPAEVAGVEGLMGVTAGVNPEKVREEAAKETWAFTCEGLGAMGDDHFFVVVTIGPGAPPAVEVQGTGLDAVARVGGRTYRFDGVRILMSDSAKAP